MTISKIILFIILIFTFIVIIQTATADPTTYTIRINPSFDTWMDNVGSWNNDTTYLHISARTPASGYPLLRSALEFDISSIPTSAVITNSTISFYVYDGPEQADIYVYLQNCTVQPSTSTYAELYDGCHEGRPGLYPNKYFKFWTIDGGIGYDHEDWLTYNTTGGIVGSSDIRDNITTAVASGQGWFGFGIFTYMKTEGTSSIKYYSTESSYYKPYLWLEYTIGNGTYVYDLAPANGTENVNKHSYGTVVYASVLHGHGHPIHYTFWCKNDTGASWVNETYDVSPYNNTVYGILSIANKPLHTYYWYVETHDDYGHWFNSSVYHFTTESVDAPTDITCTRHNSTALNVSFDPDDATNWTHVIYKAGSNPTSQDISNYENGSYSYYENTTTNWVILHGLTPDECYGLKLISYYSDGVNITNSPYASHAYGDCCLWGNVTNLYIRYENTSTDGRNGLINLSQVSPCATHEIEVTYTNKNRETFYINSSDFTSYPITLNLTSRALYYTLHWNATPVIENISYEENEFFFAGENIIFALEHEATGITSVEVYNCSGDLQWHTVPNSLYILANNSLYIQAVYNQTYFNCSGGSAPFNVSWIKVVYYAVGCECSDLTPSYKRRLLSQGLEVDANGTNLTFYMTTDKQIYEDTDCEENQWLILQGNMGRYDYQLTDLIGIFKANAVSDTFATITSSNSTENHIIHQEYLDTKMLLDDIVLVYDKTYYLSLDNSLVSATTYANIDQLKTDNQVSPYANSIEIPYILPPISNINDNWTIEVGFTGGATGMYVSFEELESNEISHLSCEIFEYTNPTTVSKVYSYETSTNNFNITYNAADHTKSYYVFINITYSDGTLIPPIAIILSPSFTEVASYTYVDDVFETIFGVLPSNLDNPTQTIQWINVIIFIFALIPLSILGVSHPDWAAIGVGIAVVGMSLMFGATALGIGVFLIFIGIIYTFGRKRR